MPILPDGRVELKNKKTGETRVIDPKELPNYGISYDSYVKQAEAYQQIPGTDPILKQEPTDAQLKSQEAAKGVGGVINELQKLYNQPTASGVRPDTTRQDDLSAGKEGAFGNLGGLVLGVKAAWNMAPDAKTYDRLKKGFTASLKEVTGDTGVLTDQDYARLSNALPNFGDSDETATKAWQSIENILAAKGIKTGFSYNDKTQPPAQDVADSKNTEQKQTNPLMDFLQRGKVGPMGVANGKDPTLLGELLFPRGSGIVKRMNKGEDISADERVGALGETVSNVLPFLSGGVGLIPRLALSGAVRGVTTPGASAGERTANATGEALLGGLLGKAGQVAPRIFSPIKTAGAARDKAAQELGAKGVQIGGEKLQKVATDMLEKRVPDYIEKPLIELLSKGKSIDPKDALELLSKAGAKTFTKGGDFKTNQASAFYKVLREAIRSEFAEKSPEILKETTRLAKGLGAQDTLKKLVFPTAIGAGVGIPISMALQKLLRGGQ